MIAIDTRMEPLPSKLLQDIEELSRLNSVTQLTCVYSPDHEKGGFYSSLLDKARKVFSSTEELARALDDIFFDELYVERQEKMNILDIIAGGNYLVFAVGLVGVGKTVVLQKIKRESEQRQGPAFIYLNLRKEISRFETPGPHDFTAEMKNWLFSEISDAIPGDKYSEWTNYQLLGDRQLEGARRAIELAIGAKLDATNVDAARKNDRVAEYILNSVQGITPSLNVLLSYVVESRIPIVLCLDNIDRRSYSEQLDAISLCDSIVQEYGIPVIVAIRHSNIRQVVKESRRRRGDMSPLSSVFFFEEFEKLQLGNSRTVEFRELHTRSIREMISRRIDFLRKHKMFTTLEKYREEYLSKHSLSREAFDRRFWEVFEDITSEFVDRGMYEYSNYNLREMFVQYVGFTSTIMLNPEEDYRWSKFLLEGRRVDRFKLRTFLIKWQISDGNVVPRKSGGIVNIFAGRPNEPSLLDIAILSYLHGFEERNRNSRLTFKEIAEDFSRLGIPEHLLREKLFGLGMSRGAHELGLIWVDKSEDDQIHHEDAIVELNPAGSYFLTSLSTTREYVFWNALLTDLDFDVAGRKFGLADTYDDEFKLTVVYDFIKGHLLPLLKRDLKQYISKIEPPSQYSGSRKDYFKEKFTRERRYYVDHLITNVSATIDAPPLSSEAAQNFRAKFSELREEMRRIDAAG